MAISRFSGKRMAAIATASALALGYLIVGPQAAMAGVPSAVKMTPFQPSVIRFFGDNRYSTAVALTKASVDPFSGDGVLYLASGQTFPDALSAGALAAHIEAPLLLTSPTSLPADVAAEIIRIEAKTIKIVGGSGAVSDGVFAAVQALNYVHDTVRISDTDRYGTNRALIRDALQGAPSPTVYIATGTDFPDALAAAPAAAQAAGVVMLVSGSASSLDADTLGLLRELRATKIVIVGGTGVVSTQIENQIVGLHWANVTRIAGNDRYETAAKIVDEAWPTGAYVAVVASGVNFPDALAASAMGIPLLTSSTNCVPVPIRAQLVKLGVGGVILAGGPGALSPAVEQLASC